MGRNGWKRTKMERNERKPKERKNINRWKQTEIDGKLTETDKKGRKLTETDGNRWNT